jgi:hypothetical protein
LFSAEEEEEEEEEDPRVVRTEEHATLDRGPC